MKPGRVEIPCSSLPHSEAQHFNTHGFQENICVRGENRRVWNVQIAAAYRPRARLFSNSSLPNH
jgi:hypothetical protein